MNDICFSFFLAFLNVCIQLSSWLILHCFFNAAIWASTTKEDVSFPWSRTAPSATHTHELNILSLIFSWGDHVWASYCCITALWPFTCPTWDVSFLGLLNGLLQKTAWRSYYRERIISHISVLKIAHHGGQKEEEEEEEKSPSTHTRHPLWLSLAESMSFCLRPQFN